ncbi:MAG: glycosyltransferase family 39 protein [Candidatus Aenigmatarchaeota archaeon]
MKINLPKIKLSKHDKLFAALLVAFFITNFYIGSQNSFVSDEGTHATVSLFYRDLILNLPNLGFNPEKIYQFGMEYMAHYPKLQVTYPPLWHLANGLVSYSIFGVNEFAARMTTLFFSAASMILMYFLAKRLFGPRVALLSTALFFANPMSMLFSYRALIDFSSWLFIFATLLTYFKAEKTGKPKYYLLTGFLAFLAAMGQRPAIILLPMIFVYSFFIKKEFKKSLIMLVPFLLLMAPYGLVLWKTGGLAMQLLVVETAGAQQGEPALFTIYNWVWYIAKFVEFSGPLALFAIGSLIYYFYKKESHWKFLLVWLAVFWIGLSIPQNKEPRFYQWLFLPAYFAFSFYAVKLIEKYRLKVILPIAALIAFYLFYSYSFVSADMNYNYIPDAEKFMQQNLTGNIAVLSEEGKTYSSEFIFLTAASDPLKEKFVFRPCAFFNMSSEEMMRTAADNSIQYVAFLKSGDESYIGSDIGKIKGILNYEKTFGDVDVYSVSNFSPKTGQICNYVCQLQQNICTNNRSPFDLLSG